MAPTKSTPINASGQLAITGSLPNTRALIKTAWQSMAPRLWSILGLSAIGILAIFCLFVLAGLAIGVGDPAHFSVSFLTGAFLLLLYLGLILISNWQTLGTIALIRGDRFIEAVKKSLNITPALFLISLILLILSIGAFGFFFIPTYIAHVWFMFAVFVLLDQNLKGFKALWASKAIVQGFGWEVFGRTLIIGATIGVASQLIGALLVYLHLDKSAIPSILAWLFILLFTPFYIAFSNAMYEALRRRPTVELKPSRVFIAIVIIGYLLLAALIFKVVIPALQNPLSLLALTQGGLPSSQAPSFNPPNINPNDLSLNDSASIDVRIRDAQRTNNIGLLATSLYKDSATHQYPASLDEILLPLITEGQISKISSPSDYLYALNPDHTKFHLGIALENPNNEALCRDADFDSSSNPNGGFNGGAGIQPNSNPVCNGQPTGDDAFNPIFDVTN